MKVGELIVFELCSVQYRHGHNTKMKEYFSSKFKIPLIALRWERSAYLKILAFFGRKVTKEYHLWIIDPVFRHGSSRIC